MITLFGYHPAFNMPSGSPFVIKSMIHLTMAGQPFELTFTDDPTTAPKGKLPYIRDGDRVIADSDVIRWHLEHTYGADFDEGLTPAERAEGLAFARLAEEHLYWCGIYEHWQVDAHWAVMKPMFFAGLPADQLDAVAEPVREELLGYLHGQGMGRHSHEEAMAFARRDLQALDDRLGDERFWFGDKPTSADAAIAPQILTVAGDPIGGPLDQASKEHPSLIAYARRVLEATIPDHLP